MGPAYSWVQASDGAFNLAGNLFGNANAVDGVPTPMIVFSGGKSEFAGDPGFLGFGTVAANVFGNRNFVQAVGSLMNATAWGNIFRTPNGSDNIVNAGTLESPTSLSWAFSYQGIFSQACSTAPLRQRRERYWPAGGRWRHRRDKSDRQPGRPRVSPSATQLNSTASNTNVLAPSPQGSRVRLKSTASNTNVLAAGGTQGNRVRSGLNAAFNRPKATSPGASVLKSVSDRDHDVD